MEQVFYLWHNVNVMAFLIQFGVICDTTGISNMKRDQLISELSSRIDRSKLDSALSSAGLRDQYSSADYAQLVEDAQCHAFGSQFKEVISLVRIESSDHDIYVNALLSGYGIDEKEWKIAASFAMVFSVSGFAVASNAHIHVKRKVA